MNLKNLATRLEIPREINDKLRSAATTNSLPTSLNEKSKYSNQIMPKCHSVFSRDGNFEREQHSVRLIHKNAKLLARKTTNTLLEI